VNPVSAARTGLVAGVLMVAAVLAGCSDGSGTDGPSAGPTLTSRSESEVRRTVAMLGSNVAHGLGKIQQFPPEDLAIVSCPGGETRDAYVVHGRFDVGATAEAWEGALAAMREQWVQLGVTKIETSGTGSAITRLAGNSAGEDSYRIVVAKTEPPRGFHIEVTSPCYRRP
jgi:hypothetical protein